MAEPVGVIGVGSSVGRFLLPQLVAAGWQAVPEPGRDKAVVGTIAHWICLVPIWTVAEHFAAFEQCGARHVVALSSTSIESKAHSPDAEEQALVARLRVGEAELRGWAGRVGVSVVLLRPTLIYGGGCDRNVSEIARLIRLTGWFPLLGKAQGRRQPVHGEDVAQACVAALRCPQAAGRTYVLSGGETLGYQEMVARVFVALEQPVRFVRLPLGLFRLALWWLRRLPRYRRWTASMITRMNDDLVFDHTDAARDLAFAPRGFVLTPADLPSPPEAG